MPKRKAAKVGPKELRAMMLERFDQIGSEPIFGNIVAEEGMKDFNTYDKSVSFHIDTSLRTGEVKGSTVTFYNGRGLISSVYIPFSDDDAYAEKVGKIINFGLHEAQTIPFDELTEERLGVEDVELVGNDVGGRSGNKATTKTVSIRTGAIKTGFFDWLLEGPSVLIMPISKVTNDSDNCRPEFDKCVAVKNYRSDFVTLGKAALQRARLALNREEANLHPDDKYHASRPKWSK